MADIPVEKKFAILTQIARASHFAWREAVVKCCPDVDPETVVNEMWDITGVQTGNAYAKRLDKDGDMAHQVAASVVWSSQSMGEDAILEQEKPGEAFVKHEGCPWFEWHKRLDLLPEDRPGCDAWFDATVRVINETLGTNVKWETQSALPDGDDCCRRRFWVDS
jgi:L-2-amino-thiazoline-4-carboxylic acid hydrolase